MVTDQFSCLAVVGFTPNSLIDLPVRQYMVCVFIQVQEDFVLRFCEQNLLAIAEYPALVFTNLQGSRAEDVDCVSN